MGSKYIDTTAIMQVIGCVFNTPQLLEITDKYSIVDEDFADPFHKTIFILIALNLLIPIDIEIDITIIRSNATYIFTA